MPELALVQPESDLQKLAMPRAIYLCGNIIYVRHPYEIEFSQDLYRENGKVKTGVTTEKAQEIAEANGFRLPTADELKVRSEGGYQDAAFNDYDAKRNPEIKYFVELLGTKLAKVKSRKGNDYIKAKDGQIKFLYNLLEGGEEKAKLWLPPSGLVREWQLGVPSETVPENQHKNGTETHWHIDFDLDEIALIGGGRWRDHTTCFYLGAVWEPSDSGSDLGFRSVRGPYAKYETFVLNESAKKEMSEARKRRTGWGYKRGQKDERKVILSDLRTLPFENFLKKYKV